MNYIDMKFANLVGGRLKNYKVKKTSPFLANFRCYFCGDSQKNKSKARGYFYESKGKLCFKCHNCSEPLSFHNFLKRVDPILYDEYVAESYLDKQLRSPKFDLEQHKKKIDLGFDPLKKLKKISQLKWDHPAKQYIVKRKIPNPFHAKLYYCPKFVEWTNSILPKKLNPDREEPRLIIPLLREDGTMFGYQGRSFDKNAEVRYISIMLEEAPKIFGLDLVKKEDPCYIFEGPIDSMFIENSLALVGSDGHVPGFLKDPIIVLDNEPRNPQIIKKMENFIDMGLKIVIWDDTFGSIKDVNEMVLAGHDPEYIQCILNKRTFQGLEAKIELADWRKRS
jgi:hypothetical protein